MIKLTTIILGLILGTGAALAERDNRPMDRVHLRSLSYAGTGCPAGSVSGAISSDSESLVLGFDQFFVLSAPGSAVRDLRKNCQVNIDMTIPAGYSYAITGVSSFLYAEIGAGSSVEFRASSYYSGALITLQLRSTIAGPKDGDIHFADQVLDRNLMWSPCGVNRRALNLNFMQRATGSLVVLKAADHGTRWIFPLKWRRCPS